MGIREYLQIARFSKRKDQYKAFRWARTGDSLNVNLEVVSQIICLTIYVENLILF